jgi:alpha-1,3-mannosyltransferase
MNVANRIASIKIKTDWKLGRIEQLSKFRNFATQPMFWDTFKPFDKLLFINDVYLCMDDVLELMHETGVQSSDMSCGFDYFREGHDSVRFYDVWVSRSLSGNMIGETKMFAKDPASRVQYEKGHSLQAYSCWNGMALMNTKPFYENNVRFRRSDKTEKDECEASECKLIAKDFWLLGYG